MFRFIASFAFAAIVALSAAAQVDKINALLITGGHDFQQQEFFEVFDKNDDIVYRHATQPGANEMFASGEAMNYDVAVLYDMYQPITEAQKEGYRRFLNAGKGLVSLHHSVANYQDWPEFTDIIGGAYCLRPLTRHGKEHPASTYKHDVVFDVNIEDLDHPIVKGLHHFSIHDEVYGGLYVHPDAHVLLTTNHPESNKELAWTMNYGGARVVYIQLGHDKFAYQNENFRTLVGNAISWADGGQGWTALFDGETLDGWKQINGTAKYHVEDGVIVGWTAEGSPNSFLCTTRDYDDFILEFDVMVDARLNSGVQVRSESKADYRDHRVHGYQVEIAENGYSGYVYDEARRGKFLNENTDKEAAIKAFKAGEWNRYRIKCEGDSIKTWINGHPLEDLTDDMTSSGFIGLQVHSFKGDSPAWVKWRNIRIKEL